MNIFQIHNFFRNSRTFSETRKLSQIRELFLNPQNFSKPRFFFKIHKLFPNSWIFLWKNLWNFANLRSFFFKIYELFKKKLNLFIFVNFIEIYELFLIPIFFFKFHVCFHFFKNFSGSFITGLFFRWSTIDQTKKTHDLAVPLWRLCAK